MENPFELLAQRLDRIEELLVKLTDKMEELPAQEKRYMGTREAAEWLRISTSSLYSQLKSIPHTKRGKRLYFDRDELASYVKNGPANQ